MEYQILKPIKMRKKRNTRHHYGTLYYDGERLKLNLLVGRGENQNLMVRGIFYLIADVLEKNYVLVKPVTNNGSTFGNNLLHITKKPKNEFENNPLYQMILRENPDIKEKIESYKRYHAKYTRIYKRLRKQEKKGIPSLFKGEV